VNTAVVVNQQAAGNLYGGGKLGMYAFWPNCSTYPDTSQDIQFEFYDYSNSSNYGEVGNDAFYGTLPTWNAAGAGIYLNSYNNVMAGELYNIYPAIANAHSNAFTAYMVNVRGETGCSPPTSGPNTIPTP
jgi:hypothetical protein